MEKEGATGKSIRGFTFIEVLITLLLLVVAISGLTSVTVSVIKGNDLSQMMTTATTLAKDKMEDLKNQASTKAGYDGLSSGSESGLEDIFTRQWSVGAIGASPPDNNTVIMQRITVTVTWQWNGQNRNLALSAIVSRPS